MAHTCPDCESHCTCDGEDTFVELGTYGPEEDFECSHVCPVDDDPDDSPYDCDGCEDNGCGLCLPNANEIANEPCCPAFPDCLHPIPRGDRAAIEESLVGTLFPEEENGG